jgi:hypothetical protein
MKNEKSVLVETVLNSSIFNYQFSFLYAGVSLLPTGCLTVTTRMAHFMKGRRTGQSGEYLSRERKRPD